MSTQEIPANTPPVTVRVQPIWDAFEVRTETGLLGVCATEVQALWAAVRAAEQIANSGGAARVVIERGGKDIVEFIAGPASPQLQPERATSNGDYKVVGSPASSSDVMPRIEPTRDSEAGRKSRKTARPSKARRVFMTAGLLWAICALATWVFAQTLEVYSGRTQGEGLTFEVHAIERLPLYLVGWPVWLYWHARYDGPVKLGLLRENGIAARVGAA